MTLEMIFLKIIKEFRTPPIKKGKDKKMKTKYWILERQFYFKVSTYVVHPHW